MVYCGLLMAASAFSVDITLPLFGQIRDDLGASNDATHAVVTLFIFCMGLGQLVFGAVADRWGRRCAIATGLSIYLLGACVAMVATSIEWMLVGRALQGLGAATGPVCARAILRDKFEGKELGKAMAVAAGIFSVGPLLAPLLGVGIAQLGGSWRMIFVAMVLAAVGMILALSRLPETIPAYRRDATSPRVFLANVREVFSDRQTRYFLLVSAWIMISMLVIVAGMPRVMEVEFGITGTLFALLFAIHGLGIIIGQFANHRMIDRFGVLPAATTAATLMTITLAVMLALSVSGLLSGYLLAVLVAVFAIGFLIVYANSVTIVMQNNGHIAGFTAAFVGFFGQLVASATATLLLTGIGSSASRWSLAIFVISLVTLMAITYWWRSEKSAGAQSKP